MSENRAIQPVVNLPAERPLSDHLAVERTAMANERTLLAYVRTSLAILAIAVTVIKFFNSQGMHMLGYVLIPGGVACFTIGLMRYNENRQKLKQLLPDDK